MTLQHYLHKKHVARILNSGAINGTGHAYIEVAGPKWLHALLWRIALTRPECAKPNWRTAVVTGWARVGKHRYRLHVWYSTVS